MFRAPGGNAPAGVLVTKPEAIRARGLRSAGGSGPTPVRPEAGSDAQEDDVRGPGPASMVQKPQQKTKRGMTLKLTNEGVEVDKYEGSSIKKKIAVPKNEAKTLKHFLTHSYRNPFCESCVKAKTRQREVKTFGDLVTFVNTK